MAQLTKAEALKSEKVEKERELQNLTDTSGASGHQKLRVCDICGAYLSVLDSDRRLADHFGGKVSLPRSESRFAAHAGTIDASWLPPTPPAHG
jgi:RNA-binding protein Luc7-like 2